MPAPVFAYMTMNRSEYEQLAEARWRRALAAGEEAALAAYLQANPDAKADWEGESQVRALLDELPDAPVSSNFTAQVLQRVRLEEAQSARAAAKQPVRFALWRWASAAAAMLALGLVVFQSHEAGRRKELAHSAAAVSAIALPAMDFLNDLEAIDGVRQAAPAPEADVELLLALQ